MATLEFTHGGVITSGQGSMDIWVNYRRDDGSVERPIQEAVKDPKSGAKEDGGLLEVTNSSNYRNGKNWIKRRCQFPDGSLVRFTIKQQLGTGVFSQSILNFIISPRESAPLQEISIEPPYVVGRNTLSVIYITGRFDIVLPKEVMERGLHINPQGANEAESYDLAALDDVMSLRVLEKAQRPKATAKVVSTSKKGTSITRVRRPRKINL